MTKQAHQVRRIDIYRITSRAKIGHVVDRKWRVVDSSGHQVGGYYDRKRDAVAAIGAPSK